MRVVRDLVIAEEEILRILGDRPLGPVDFLESNAANSFIEKKLTPLLCKANRANVTENIACALFVTQGFSCCTGQK